MATCFSLPACTRDKERFNSSRISRVHVTTGASWNTLMISGFVRRFNWPKSPKNSTFTPPNGNSETSSITRYSTVLQILSNSARLGLNFDFGKKMLADLSDDTRLLAILNHGETQQYTIYHIVQPIHVNLSTSYARAAYYLLQYLGSKVWSMINGNKRRTH
ncbi:hypothetical protein CALVIDRAFT_530476 [Calocera viscosa TUFC12733]|uniref:Uncharacterized protein n=1 Tax=Calocera viscosa (strain TUFC12733) TaxID=1330018 RepID=A0A167HR79_CALVF|nr:hypothetical protein CALVIDRAFT_530476 [Calocera viscosa TUFC12733]